MLIDTAQPLDSLQIDKSSHMCIQKHLLLSFVARNASSEGAVQGIMKEDVKSEVVKALEA